MMVFKDKFWVDFKSGDIININQSVNGCSIFLILDLTWSHDTKHKYIKNLDIRYYYNPTRKYEYDGEELLTLPSFNEDGVEIIGSIYQPNYELNKRLYEKRLYP